MKLAKFALTPSIVAISVALCAALSSFGAGVTDETWGEAWNTSSVIGLGNMTIDSNQNWSGNHTADGVRGSATMLFNNTSTTSADLLHTMSKGTLWVKMTIKESCHEGNDIVLKKYRIDAGSNARAPKTWAIYGAADESAQWGDSSLVLIDSRLNVSGTTSADYDCSSNVMSFRTYFFVVEANNGDGLLQICEWYLFGEIKEHEERILYSVSSPYSGHYDGYPHGIYVTATYPETGVSVVYSTDGMTWGETAPVFKKVGEHTVHYRLSAEGFPTVEKTATISIQDPPQKDVDIVTTVRNAEKASGETLHTIEATEHFFNAGCTYASGSPENFIDGFVKGGSEQQKGGWVNGRGSLTYEVADTYRPGDSVVARGVSFACGKSAALDGATLRMPRNWKLEAYDASTLQWVELVSFSNNAYPEWTDGDVITREGIDCYYRETLFENETAYRKYRLTILSGRTHIAEIGLLGDIVMADDSVIIAQGVNYLGTFDGQPHGIALKVTNPSEGYVVSYRMKGEETWSVVNPTFVEPIPASQPKIVEWKVEAEGFETVSGENTVVINYQDLTALVRTETPTERTATAVDAFYTSGSSATIFVDGTASQRNGWVNGGTFDYEFLSGFRSDESISVRGVKFATDSGSAKDNAKIVMPRSFTVLGWNEEIEDWIELAAFTTATVPEWTDDDLKGGIYSRIFDFDNPYSFRKYRISFAKTRAHVGEISFLGITGGEVVKPIVCSGSDYAGVYDGAAHGISVDVRAPVEGATVWYRWGERKWTTEEQLFKGPVAEADNTRTVYWKVVADGYRTVEGANTVTITDLPHADLDIMAQVRAAGKEQGASQLTIDACLNAGGFGNAEGPQFFDGDASQRIGWAGANGTLVWTIADTFRPGEKIVVNGIGFAGKTGSNIVINNGQVVMPTRWTLEGSLDGEAWAKIYTCTESPAWGDDDIVSAADFGTAYNVYYRRIDFANTTAYRHYRLVFPASRVHVSEIYLYGDIGKNRRERLPGLGFSVIVR